jgi:ubiquinone/menaquinone biosynthesis C-methylase UbiE
VSAKQKKYFSSVKYRDPADPVVAAYADPKLDFIRKHVPLNGRILDVGCGNGVFTGRLAREGGHVVGLDFSRHLLDENRHASLVCGDVATLPFRDATFDVVFEANVLHHIDDRLAVVREMTRVSRRYVVLLEPNRYNPLMLGFSLVIPAERGGLKSSLRRLQEELREAGARVTASIVTGMISQNNTPRALVPLLQQFDRPIAWGEYLVTVAETSRV